MAISPNGTQVWANGLDACSAPFYDHAGCPIVPAGVVNVIRTADNVVVKTIGFPNGVDLITIAPDSSQAFVGGPSLVIFDTSTFAQVDSVAIAASGSLAFIPDGFRAYAPVPSENAVKVLQIAPPAFPSSGVFVIGDETDTGDVTWWSAQWSTLNRLSGGQAPAAFKGFVSHPSTTPPHCGGTWTTEPGNSANPPDSVPSPMAVIVSSQITKHGNTIAGDIVKIVTVETDPGYAPNPGHEGTGTVTNILCQQ